METAALVPKPTMIENKLPAHVGQPMKRPLNIPKVEAIENFLGDSSLNFLRKLAFNAKLIPTNVETIIASIRFKGIIKIENNSVSCIVIIGTYPG